MTTYVLRKSGRPPEYTTTPGLSVRFRRLSRDTGRMIGGMFREVEDAGIDENTLQITGFTANGAKSSKGHAPQRYWHYVRRRLHSVHEQVRVVRAVDETAIAEIDAEIERLRHDIGEQQRLRHEAVVKAWRFGEHVSLPELVEIAESNRRPEVTS